MCENIREEICAYMRRVYDRGLTTCLGGNISCRNNGSVFITPSGVDKQNISSSDILEIDLCGNLLSGSKKPSIETAMHTMIYACREDVKAVIHAHSFYSSLFSALDIEINTNLVAESAHSLGRVGVSEYAEMGTPELAKAVSEKASVCNAVIMRNHGVVTVGSTLLEAFYRLELVEQAAKMTLLARGQELSELK